MHDLIIYYLNLVADVDDVAITRARWSQSIRDDYRYHFPLVHWTKSAVTDLLDGANASITLTTSTEGRCLLK